MDWVLGYLYQGLSAFTGALYITIVQDIMLGRFRDPHIPDLMIK